MRIRFALLLLTLCLNIGCAYNRETIAELGDLPIVHDRRKPRIAALDNRIEIKAREALLDDMLTPYQSHININVYNGTLLATGEALEEGIHDQIIEKLRIILGVKRVQDEIAIGPSTHVAEQAADSQITNRLLTELDHVQHPTVFSSANIIIVTENGSVYLLGLVYPDEADVATNVAQKIPGVNKVVKLFEYLQ